jgi:hypothetical protein
MRTASRIRWQVSELAVLAAACAVGRLGRCDVGLGWPSFSEPVSPDLAAPAIQHFRHSINPCPSLGTDQVSVHPTSLARLNSRMTTALHVWSRDGSFACKLAIQKGRSLRTNSMGRICYLMPLTVMSSNYPHCFHRTSKPETSPLRSRREVPLFGLFSNLMILGCRWTRRCSIGLHTQLIA